MKKYIFIKIDGYDSKAVVIDEIDPHNKQNRMDLFAKYYDVNKLEKNGYLNILSEIQMEKLKNEAIFYLSKEYMNSLSRSDKGNFPENYFSTKKLFLNKEYLLDSGEDRLALLAIDLYNINLFAKDSSNEIIYITADTKADAIKLEF